MLLLAVAAGLAAGLGVWLVVVGLLPVDADQLAARHRQARSRWQAGGRRVVLGVLAAAAVTVLTRWPVAGLAAGGLVVVAPLLFGGGRDARRAVERLDALAVWSEAVRDLSASGIALAQALPAAAGSAPAPVAPAARRLADWLRVRQPIELALGRFADDLDDPAGDLVVSALLLNARVQGGQLRAVLGALATSIRAELEVRRRVEAERRATRRGAALVAALTTVMATGLFVLNRTYLDPFDGPTGQAVLGLVLLLFGAGFGLLRRLSTFQVAQRFLIGDRPGPGGAPAAAGRTTAVTAPAAERQAAGPAGPPGARAVVASRWSPAGWADEPPRADNAGVPAAGGSR